MDINLPIGFFETLLLLGYPRNTSKVPVPELPEEILIEIFKYLDEKDIKNVHLVSRSFHQAAEFYPYKLSFRICLNQCEVGNESRCRVQTKTLSIEQSPRVCIYETVEILGDQNSSLCHHIEIFLEKFGTSIKNLELRSCNINQQTFFRILNLLPNLKSLSMTSLTITEQQGIEEKTINLPKLKILTIQRSREVYSKILKFINCSITQLDTDDLNENFVLLQKNETSLKKLTFNVHPILFALERSNTEIGIKMLMNLKSLRLEHFHFVLSTIPRITNISFDQQNFSTFLSQHKNMKFLNLVMPDTKAENYLSTICDSLQNLETLKVQMSGTFLKDTEKKLSNFKLLKNLHLTLTDLDTVAVLNALSLEKNEKFEILEMKSAKDYPTGNHPDDLHLKIPYLRKITLDKQDTEIIHYILENFRNLEYFEATDISNGLLIKNCYDKKLRSSKLTITGSRSSAFTDIRLLTLFQNLEYLYMYSIIFDTDDNLQDILRKLPTLKELIITSSNSEFSYEAANYIFSYGRYLEKIEIPNSCAENHTRRKLQHKNLHFKCSNFEIKFPCYDIQPTHSRRTTTSRSRRSYDYFDDDDYEYLGGPYTYENEFDL